MMSTQNWTRSAGEQVTGDARDTPELSSVKLTTAKTRHMVLDVYSKYKKRIGQLQFTFIQSSTINQMIYT